MRVPEKLARDALIREVIRLHWSVGEVNTALKASRGRRAGVGKRPKIPRGGRRLLVALEAHCLRFGRWVDVARSAVPADLRAAIDQAAVAVAGVQRAVAERLAGTERS